MSKRTRRSTVGRSHAWFQVEPPESMPLPPAGEVPTTPGMGQGERTQPLPPATTVKVRTSAARLRRALTHTERQGWEGGSTADLDAAAWGLANPALGKPIAQEPDLRRAMPDLRRTMPDLRRTMIDRRSGGTVIQGDRPMNDPRHPAMDDALDRTGAESWDEIDGTVDDWDRWEDPVLEASEPTPMGQPPPRQPPSHPSTPRSLGYRAPESRAPESRAPEYPPTHRSPDPHSPTMVRRSEYGRSRSLVNGIPEPRTPEPRTPEPRTPEPRTPEPRTPEHVWDDPQAQHLIRHPDAPAPVMAAGHPMAQHDWGVTAWAALRAALRSPWWGAIAPVGAAALLLASPLMWQHSPPPANTTPAIATTLGCMGDAPNPNRNGQLSTRQLEHLQKLIGQTQGSITSQLGEPYCDLPRVAMRSGAILERRAYLHNNQPVVLGFETGRLIGYRHWQDAAAIEGRPTNASPDRRDQLEIDLKQNWGIVQGSTMAGHRVIGGLGGLAIASNGPVYAPVAGTVYRQLTFITNGQLSQGSGDCVVLGSERVPAYLVQLCGMSRTHAGSVTAGQRIGRATGYLHVAVLRQDGEQWMFVPPAPELFGPLLGGQGDSE